MRLNFKCKSDYWRSSVLCIFMLCTAVKSGISQANPAPPAVGADATAVRYLDQGWDAKMRELYYFTPQGSHLIPYSWFLAIEQRNNNQPFSSQANLEKYRWIWAPENSGTSNPDNLPVGFTKGVVDVKDTGKWLGWTCAACHTGQLTYKGQAFRVDGGAANADVGRFLVDLADTVQANVIDPEKLGRFINKVLGPSPTPESAEKLQKQSLLYSATLKGQVAMRTPTHPEGPGRVDALGQIITAMSVFQLGEADNYQSPDAPVSFPFLWITPKLDWVQWSPISSNPIGRNAGEVLGVFADVELRSPGMQANLGLESVVASERADHYAFLAKHSVPEGWATKGSREGKRPLMPKLKPAAGLESMQQIPAPPTLKSSVEYKNLYNLEQWLTTLTEPKWNEEVFGKIDRNLGKLGAQLFQRDCRGCHNMPPYEMTKAEENIDGKQFIKVGKIPYKAVGTDPLYIQNLVGRFSKTGDLGPVLFGGDEVVPAANFFLGGVAAVVEKGLDTLGLSPEEKLRYSDYRYYPAAPGEKPKPYRPDLSAGPTLKAGPLFGIWATGPFLHNGSVPNLYELLSPASERSAKFWVGNREFDPKLLGFVSSPDNGSFELDTSVPGNGNMGHNYPATPYVVYERLAVLEFLKNPTGYTETP